MSAKNYLEQAERRIFRASFEGGLLEIAIAAFLLMLAIAPLLSVFWGDFWSSFVFLPFFGLVYLLLRWVRKKFVVPRIGSVSFGPERIAKMRRGSIVMLVLNVIFLLLGFLAFFYAGSAGSGWLVALIFSAVTLLFASMVGYLNDLPQLYVYGLLCALGVPLGEWFWQQGIATHHGYPLVFGAISAGIFLYGLLKFARLMRTDVPGFEDLSGEEDV